MHTQLQDQEKESVEIEVRDEPKVTEVRDSRQSSTDVMVQLHCTLTGEEEEGLGQGVLSQTVKNL